MGTVWSVEHVPTHTSPSRATVELVRDRGEPSHVADASLSDRSGVRGRRYLLSRGAFDQPFEACSLLQAEPVLKRM